MIQLKRGTNIVKLSLTSSFTPLLKFEKIYTGDIHICKRSTTEQPLEVTIEANKDQILDLGAYREYFTEYRDEHNVTITLNAPATLEYEPVQESLIFTVNQDPSYTPPHIEDEPCPICQTTVPKSNLMSHIQTTHIESRRL